jgi:nitrogen fixation NifU-like protein
MYSAIVMEHFANPRNVGRLDSPDSCATVKSEIHGDVIELCIRVVDGRIAEVGYLTFGCVASIASSSITSEMATGLTLEQALAITAALVEAALGGLPEGKRECSVLAPEAIRQAILTYRREHPGATQE